MSAFGIMMSWVLLMVAILLFAFTVEMLWRGFALLFGMVDNYVQNRRLKNRGYVLMESENGTEYWVGYGE